MPNDWLSRHALLWSICSSPHLLDTREIPSHRFPFSHLRPEKLQTVLVLAFIWILGFVIAVVPLLNEDLFGNYYGRNGVCFPLHSDGLEKPIAKAYSTGIFLGSNHFTDLMFTDVFKCFHAFSSFNYSMNVIHTTSQKFEIIQGWICFIKIIFWSWICFKM